MGWYALATIHSYVEVEIGYKYALHLMLYKTIFKLRKVTEEEVLFTPFSIEGLPFCRTKYQLPQSLEKCTVHARDWEHYYKSICYSSLLKTTC